jgi:hypothetical protein
MTLRRMTLIALALVAGTAIGLMDSSPGWDSTGITAGLLLLVSAIIAAIAGDRPWLWAVLVGGPLPLFELPGGSTGSLIAIGFAAVGATIGWAASRAGRESAEGSRRE